MTEAPKIPSNDDTNRPAAERIMLTPVFIRSGTTATIEQAFELAVSLDHLKRERPDLLTNLRTAYVKSKQIEATPDDVAKLEIMRLVSPSGRPMINSQSLVLAMLGGADGHEIVENPFLDYSSRALFDYLRNGALVSMLLDPHEVKAVHENNAVSELLDAAPNSTWVGYVKKDSSAGKGPPPPPSRN